MFYSYLSSIYPVSKLITVLVKSSISSYNERRERLSDAFKNPPMGNNINYLACLMVFEIL